MTELSFSAQSILNAAKEASWDWSSNAPVHYSDVAIAVLIAVVDQQRLNPEHWEGSMPNDYEKGWNAAIESIQRIITKLENHK